MMQWRKSWRIRHHWTICFYKMKLWVLTQRLLKHKITARSCVKSVCIAFWNRHMKLLWLSRTSEPIYRIGRKIAGMILMLNCFIPNNNIKFPWGSFRDNCIKHILLNISWFSPRIDLAQKDPSESIFLPIDWNLLFPFLQTGLGRNER